MNAETEIQIQNERAVFNQNVRVAGRSVDDSRPLSGRLELSEDRLVNGAGVELCVQGGSSVRRM